MATTVALTQPSGEMWKKIRTDLNEDLRKRDQDLATIKNWLKKQPHLPPEMEDTCIMSFLRGCSFSLEKCKKKIDMYFTMRTACPEFFTNRDITHPELSSLMDKLMGPTLPGLTPKGTRVTICKATDKNLGVDCLIHVFKLAMMIADIRLIEEVEGIAGDIYVLDASIVSATHLAQLSPAVVKKFFICVQDAYPLKLKEIHVINASPIIDVLYKIIKPFLKEKLRKRIHFHTDVNRLKDYIPADMLPIEYGGTDFALEEIHRQWVKKLEEYVPWFKEQESHKSDESLRPGNPTNFDELFGIDGSFRQLSID